MVGWYSKGKKDGCRSYRNQTKQASKKKKRRTEKAHFGDLKIIKKKTD